MARRCRMRGLTLTEVVVLVVVLSFLVVVIALFPRRRRSVAFRMVCGSNLAGIGKAMMIYANDYDDVFPCAGGPGGSWAARTPNWMGRDRFEAYGAAPDSLAAGQASISASLYLLVKYAEVAPKSFVCPQGEPQTTEFDPAPCPILPEAGPCLLFRFSLEQASLRAEEGNCILRSTALGSFLAAAVKRKSPRGKMGRAILVCGGC